MRWRKRPGGRSGVGTRISTWTFILSALVMMSAACSAEQVSSPQVPAKYEDAQTGAARLMADATLRIHGIVDVTDAYPDPSDDVVGAAVLLDRSIGKEAARTDFHKRPVFVAYTDQPAAKRAIRGHMPGTYLRRYANVILPACRLPKGRTGRLPARYGSRSAVVPLTPREDRLAGLPGCGLLGGRLLRGLLGRCLLGCGLLRRRLLRRGRLLLLLLVGGDGLPARGLGGVDRALQGREQVDHLAGGPLRLLGGLDLAALELGVTSASTALA